MDFEGEIVWDLLERIFLSARSSSDMDVGVHRGSQQLGLNQLLQQQQHHCRNNEFISQKQKMKHTQTFQPCRMVFYDGRVAGHIT